MRPADTDDGVTDAAPTDITTSPEDLSADVATDLPQLTDSDDLGVDEDVTNDRDVDASDESRPDDADAMIVDGSDDSPVDDGQDVEPVDTGSQSSELRIFENPSNVLSFFVLWKTGRPTTTVLTVTCDEDFSHRYESPRLSVEHEVFVMGLWPSADCRFETTGVNDLGDPAPTLWSTVEVSELPSAVPQPAGVETIDTERIQPGWTVLNINKASQPPSATAVIIDEHGQIRWYNVFSSGRVAGANTVTVVDDGILIGGSGLQFPTSLVGWDGHTAWEVPFGTHHEAGFIRNDTELFLLLAHTRCSDDDTEPTSPLIAWDPSTQTELWRWHICDDYQPPVMFTEWAHLNGADAFPDGDAIIVSSRHQSALIRVDFESRDIDWVLGYGGRPEDGWNGDFAMSEADRFLEQHAPEVQPNGNILIFDNGSCMSCSDEARPLYERGWSRAIEIAYDTDTWQAEVVWEFRPQPDMATMIFGDADRLPNGNTLVTFGENRLDRDPRIFEVTSSSEVVWELVLGLGQSAYRADRIEPYYGYVVEAEE